MIYGRGALDQGRKPARAVGRRGKPALVQIASYLMRIKLSWDLMQQHND